MLAYRSYLPEIGLAGEIFRKGIKRSEVYSRWKFVRVKASRSDREACECRKMEDTSVRRKLPEWRVVCLVLDVKFRGRYFVRKRVRSCA